MKRILVLLGATATGKTAAALAIAAAVPAEIVNADALQVYRGLDIGTGKPTAGERAEVRHHLLDILDPRERFSAGEFARRARAAVAEIEGRGALPIVVGGSGLYLRALLEGLSPLPAGSVALRQELRDRCDRDGLVALHEELGRLDPPTAARLPPADRQRILRALEVTVATGRPFSAWLQLKPADPVLSALRVGLTLPRPILYDRIGGRVRSMVESGWLDEVARLLREGVPPQSPAFQAIGYREMTKCALGQCDLEQAIAETTAATRRFAKRQETWFRKDRDVVWVAADDPAGAAADIRRLMSEAGLGGTNDDNEAQHQYSGRIPVPEPQGGPGGGR